jgi:hypothetical protein
VGGALVAWSCVLWLPGLLGLWEIVRSSRPVLGSVGAALDLARHRRRPVAVSRIPRTEAIAHVADLAVLLPSVGLGALFIASALPLRTARSAASA